MSGMNKTQSGAVEIDRRKSRVGIFERKGLGVNETNRWWACMGSESSKRPEVSEYLNEISAYTVYIAQLQDEISTDHGVRLP